MLKVQRVLLAYFKGFGTSLFDMVLKAAPLAPFSLNCFGISLFDMVLKGSILASSSKHGFVVSLFNMVLKVTA